MVEMAESESALKRQRIMDDGAGDVASSSFAHSNDETITPAFPSLAFTIFIEKVEDEKLLRLCRLVCKSWNDGASNVLRKRFCVTLPESREQHLENLRRLLLTRAFDACQLPLPFQNVNVVATQFQNECFKSLISVPSMSVSALSLLLIPQNRHLDQRALATFLVDKGNQIKRLRIRGKSGHSGVDENIMGNDQIRLTALKNVSFSDHSSLFSEHTDFVEKLTRFSSLESLELKGGAQNMISSLLTNDRLRTVKQLDINTCMMMLRNKDWEALENLAMANLEKLSLHSTPTPDCAEKFARLIRKISSTLKVLSSCLVKLELLPTCPKLQKISMCFESQINEFKPSRFPALKEIELKDSIKNWVFLANEYVPHPGITKFTLSLIGSEAEQHKFASLHMHIFLANLSRQFPNIENYSLSIRPFDSSVFLNIHRTFPALKRLGILSRCDFFHMSGVHMDVIWEYQRRGWPVESIPRKNSVFDFSSMEHLFLGAECFVTRDVIIFCLSKIPSLKTVEFFWIVELDSQLIRDCLSHLEKVTIHIGFPSNRQQIDELYPLPNIELVVQNTRDFSPNNI